MAQLYPGTRRANPAGRVDYSKSFSGMYESSATGGYGETKLELKIDVDSPGPYQKGLNYVSGTVRTTSKKKWSGEATAAFFRSYKGGVTVTSQGDHHQVRCQLFVVLSDGSKREGNFNASSQRSRGHLRWKISISVESQRHWDLEFSDVERKSKHFRDVKLDIDYVDKVTWPTIEAKNYRGGPANMKNRKLDLFSVFEDAGLKLHYSEEDSEKVEDPTPGTSWTKADMYAVMDDYFDENSDNDQNIWCLMATNPPDSRYMGFSFDNDGKRGFGLFSGHTSFNGMNSSDSKVKANALRRYLHYMAHECGHCLGLKHPFEEGNPNSLSWMNYAWKYDATNRPGSFYERFRYSFSDDELVILRHQPDKLFKDAYLKEKGSRFEFAPAPKSDAPDYADDESDDDDEEEGPYKKRKLETPIPRRKINFRIKVRPEPFKKGDIVELEAILRNVGKLPGRIEPGFQPGGGNMTVYVTDPDGTLQIARPCVHGIDAPTRRFVTLGRPGSREHSDTYSEVVPLLYSSNGLIFRKLGTYYIKAIYEGAGIRLSSTSTSVRVEADDEEDEDVAKQVSAAASIGGSPTAKQAAIVAYWKKLVKKSVAEKRKRIQTLLMLLDAFSKDGVQVSKAGSRTRTAARRGGKKLERVAAVFSGKQLIADTDDLIGEYATNYGFSAVELINYANLVHARAKLQMKSAQTAKADAEYSKLVSDLVRDDADSDFVKRVTEQWKSLLSGGTERRASDSARLQSRFEALFNWFPTEDIEDEKDASGLGIGSPFNNFDDDHKDKAYRFIEELKRVEEDTDDLDAVLDYAESLQKSFEVNSDLYKFVIECYIVHSTLAKKYHMRYPDPPKPDKSVTSMAAMKLTVRKGSPTESWMNYWRCDADFNFHHRHWHAVYWARNYRQSYIKRQGELFGYMHSQMLARYDADRESWGMAPVKAYEVDEVESDGFNAGMEFHDHPQNRKYVPRPPGLSWPKGLQAEMSYYEQQLLAVYEAQDLLPPQFESEGFNANFAGHLIEATTGIFRRDFGGLHNSGHMGFTLFTNNMPGRKTSYMGSSVTAVRDPIFFRWHKRVDNVLQTYYDTVETEIGDENPGVVVNSCDVLILPGRDAPKGFDQWTGSGWKDETFTSAKVNTFLREPELAFEWDNKLDHEEFSFHIRLRRKEGVTGEMRLTLRMFICQERHINNRRKWIEMDKFVHFMNANEDHAVLKRLDRHSSVIKRMHEDADGIDEMRFVQSTPGNCECGWPYRMMLPRGNKDGEKWMLALFVSNNETDGITVSSKCGSMSYCGTQDKTYPDKRMMGYPLATPLTINDQSVTISDAAEQLSNFCMSPFTIVNDFNHVIPKPPPPVAWAPYSILGETGAGDFNSSRLTGRFRVLLDDLDFRAMGVEKMRIKFKGRSADDASYAIADVKVALRQGNTLNIDPKCNVDVKFEGSTRAEVTKDGLLSDEIVLPVKTAPENDYFVTFTLKSPGCYVKNRSVTRFNSCYLPSVFLRPETEPDENWEEVNREYRRNSMNLYCIECVVADQA